MKSEILTLSSVTHALMAKRLLMKNGIRAKLVKLNSKDSGCTHAIEIPRAELLNAAAILRSNDIPYFLK